MSGTDVLIKEFTELDVDLDTPPLCELRWHDSSFIPYLGPAGVAEYILSRDMNCCEKRTKRNLCCEGCKSRIIRNFDRTHYHIPCGQCYTFRDINTKFIPI